ncbi:MAG: TetR/AcrR family transcriptional regulator [Aquabacterium sp.]|jgi:AcrR family transcriptional regulator|uniref:TetR/AcrR family transcriptional regulator n=1 Tax=Aquabacterium sp. TaxID=1872578 RepID=UPI003BAF50AF
MNKPLLSTKRSRASAKRPAPPSRVRRGNEADQQALRQAALDAAKALFREGGLAGVTMRAVAARVGVSAMALYRYFPSKADLLHGLWESTITELQAELTTAVDAAGAHPQARLRAWVDAFLSYYEGHPDSYRLVFMLDRHETEAPETPSWEEHPIFREVLQASTALSRDVADALGGDCDEARLRHASELRLLMSVGYLHSRLINTRHPWSDMQALRATTINLIVQAVESCLRPEPIN